MTSLATAAAAQDGAATYRATLAPLNAEVVGSKSTGEATFAVWGNELTIHATVNGAPPNIAHLQHFHEFAEGERQSECPIAESDVNGDGIVDLIETERSAGITMVPFHDDPASMEIVRDTYPTANAKGSYTYERTVSLSAPRDAFAAKFSGQQLDLTRRVVLFTAYRLRWCCRTRSRRWKTSRQKSRCRSPAMRSSRPMGDEFQRLHARTAGAIDMMALAVLYGPLSVRPERLQ